MLTGSKFGGQLNQADKQVICSACRIQFNTVMDYKLHIISDFHVFNTKRKVLNLEPVTEEIFEQKKATVALSEVNSQVSEVLFKCYPCKKQFKCLEQLDQHKQSKNHKKNEKLYQQQNKLDTSSNHQSQQSSMFHNLSKDHTDHHHLNNMLNQSNDSKKIDNYTDLSHDEDNKFLDPTKEHHEQQLKQQQEDYDSQNDSKLPQRTSMESLRICLFCNREFPGVKKCLDHMRTNHSFFILDVDCCINLKGLLTYIAERIQLGYLCLFCSKMFKNSRRCQQHMMDKSHCFMNPNDEREFELFYDFAKLYDKLQKQSQNNNNSNNQSEEDSKSAQNNQQDFQVIDGIQTPIRSHQASGTRNLEDAWEDIDIEDANEEELALKAQEFMLNTPQKSVDDDSEKFSIISDSDGGQAAQVQSSSSNQGDFINVGTNSNASDKFTMINPSSVQTFQDSSTSHNHNNSQGPSFKDIKDGNHRITSEQQKQFCDASVSSIQGGDSANFKQGLTRAQAWAKINTGKPELLESGEIRLPSGRIIGTRDMNYIYKQRFKPEDNRDSVILAKLSLEYKSLKSLSNGDERALIKNNDLVDQLAQQMKIKQQREQQNKNLKTSMARNNYQRQPKQQ